MIKLFLFVSIAMAACSQKNKADSTYTQLTDSTSKCDKTLAGSSVYCVTAFWDEKKVRIIRANENSYDTIWIPKPE